MTIILAQHLGMCFGVRDALEATRAAAERGPLTVLGQLVHNPVVERKLAVHGVERGDLERLESARTHQVAITAHGAADVHRRAWAEAGHEVIDTTCPLVRKAHEALAGLVRSGYHPVVIGQRGHVEVRGLTGDFPQASVVLYEAELGEIPAVTKLGIVAQTTQPIELVRQLVEAIRQSRPGAGVRFVDTVCLPTKQRQSAMEELVRQCDHIVVIGGRNSNNTRQLAEKAAAQGRRTIRVEGADELEPGWFSGARVVGVTAGTSTLDETVEAVVARLKSFGTSAPSRLF